MRFFLKTTGKTCLPTADELVAKMWKDGVNVSRVGWQESLRESTGLTLSWDKWLDDKRWSGNSQSKEHIYFEVVTLNSNLHLVFVEVDEDACLVDIRAVHKAVIHIAERCCAKISIDQTTWIDVDEYRQEAKEYIQLSFEEANERSLQECME